MYAACGRAATSVCGCMRMGLGGSRSCPITTLVALHNMSVDADLGPCPGLGPVKAATRAHQFLPDLVCKRASNSPIIEGMARKV